MKIILYIGLIICFAYGFFWKGMFENGFFIMQALSFFLLSMYIFLKEKSSFICYLWFCFAFSNLMDELFFNPLVIGLNEKVFIITVPIIWIIKTRHYARKIPKQ